MIPVTTGTTSKLIRIFVNDSSVTTGAGLTGLCHSSVNLAAYYIREGATSTVALSLTPMAVGSWVSAGFKEVDSTNTPGLYEVGIPDAALVSGAASVVLSLKGATNMAPVVKEVPLTRVDFYDSVRAGLTALPGAAAATNGGLPILVTNGLSVSSLAAGVVTAAAVATGAIDADALAADAIAAIWAKAMSDLSAVPGVTGSVLDAVNWLFIVARNKRTQTATTETVYKNDGSTSVATSTKSDDSTTFTRGKYT